MLSTEPFAISTETDTLTIRHAQRADLSSLNAIRARAFRVLGGRHYSEQQIESMLAHKPGLDAHLIDDDTYFVAEVDDRIVGGGGWSFRSPLLPGPADDVVLDPATDAARIRAFFVDPDFTRRGIDLGNLVFFASNAYYSPCAAFLTPPHERRHTWRCTPSIVSMR